MTIEFPRYSDHAKEHCSKSISTTAALSENGPRFHLCSGLLVFRAISCPKTEGGGDLPTLVEAPQLKLQGPHCHFGLFHVILFTTVVALFMCVSVDLIISPPTPEPPQFCGVALRSKSTERYLSTYFSTIQLSPASGLLLSCH